MLPIRNFSGYETQISAQLSHRHSLLPVAQLTEPRSFVSLNHVSECPLLPSPERCFQRFLEANDA